MERHDEQQQEKPHKRRIHYSGRYPRHFAEKYKELNPEKYGEEIAHVRAKGNTPAGTHIPIMVKEILEILAIKPGERGFDATLGYGGHTLAMLEKLEGKGHLYGGDVDPIESEKTEARIRAKGFGPDIWERRLMNFCEIDKLAAEAGPFDFVLADLGVSSMQIDNPERGFTYKSDGPLDLRLNPEAGISAADRLRQLDYEELVGMMQENADEPYAEAIARQVGLAAGDVIADVMPADKERQVRELQAAGQKVAMVGDGINDSPALARADVGLAIGTGADIAKGGADVVLMRSDLMDVARAVELSRAVIRNIKQDLFWALIYNGCGIPLAAGVFYPLTGWQLSPMFGAAAMSLSSLCVVSNALRLRAFKPKVAQ